jgi:glutamate/tyrosine decarboxylase-like PLP-dependent enzyme
MELIIPGLILVALMVWASTKIKRSAAKAFDAEHIEGDGFAIDKPDGFLNRHYDNSEYLFDAYSKEFGADNAANVRAATAVVFSTDESINEAASLEQTRLLNSDRSERFELDGRHCIIVTGREERDGHRFDVSEKLLECGARTVVLKVEALPEATEDLSRRIEHMILSFSPR